ncbi:MAG: FMN-binding protein [Bacilli bacterium]
MKRNNKIILMGVIGLALLSGCSKGYKEGIYTGTAIDSYGGQNNTATAIVTVDKNGKITDVDLDTTYTKDGVETTKKKLGDSYGMYGGEYGSQVGEWYQQVEALEKNVVDNQGLDKIKMNDEGYTDAVSGCTIKIDALYEALENALKQAKK